MLFGFLGLGLPELVILALLGFVVVAVVAVVLIRRAGRDRNANLAEENRRLRKRLDELEDENQRFRV